MGPRGVKTRPLRDIRLRDPFVLPARSGGLYYLYGSTDPNTWSGPGRVFDAYVGGRKGRRRPGPGDCSGGWGDPARHLSPGALKNLGMNELDGPFLYVISTFRRAIGDLSDHFTEIANLNI